MTDQREAETEAEVRLRGVLEPDEEALARVVRRALGRTEAEGLDPADRTDGPEQAERTGSKQRARRARRSPTGGRRGRWARVRPRRLLVPLAGGLAGVAAVLAFLLASLGGPHDVSRPQPGQRPGSGSAFVSHSTSASVTHRDGVLIVRRQDGGTSLLDARAGRSAEPRGMTIILKGERP